MIRRYDSLIKTIFLTLVLISYLNYQISNVVDGHTNENDQETFSNSNDHCSNPTMEITIAVTGPLSYDRDVIEVPMDTCITVWFLNTIDIPHSFAIAPVESNNGIDAVYMNLENATAVCGQASSDSADIPGAARFNIKTPNEVGDIAFYCSYPGHHESGMEGVLRVIDDQHDPDLENSVLLFVSLFITVIALLVVLKVTIKKL
ncbi:MAG: hypothetical protein GPJ54_02800 [Candidatus Heimdallarchaeota archaeon]|nr:hypothetical protein [Candidatus Heimdallarchaeota archaeon]